MKMISEIAESLKDKYFGKSPIYYFAQSQVLREELERINNRYRYRSDLEDSILYLKQTK